MAKLTREEVIARVRERKSLAREDLSGLDLSKADLVGANFGGANLSKAILVDADLFAACLYHANLSHANLSNADLSSTNLAETNLSGAYLTRANLFNANLMDADLTGSALFAANLRESNLRESNLDSANLHDANLSGADLTGVNIYNVATADWKIEGVKCEYAYNCKYWGNKEELEKTRRDFAPGEFEQIYKSFPRLELIFKDEFSHLDHRALLAVIDRINQELPTANLNLRKMERVGNTTTTTLAAENKEAIEEIVKDLLQKHYSKIHDELKAIKGIPALQNISSQLPQQVSDMLHPLLKEIIEQPSDKMLNLNINMFVGNEFRGQMGIGNQTVSIKYNIEIINNFLERLESSSFDDTELSGTYKELQDHYDNLDEQGKEGMLKLIAEKANKNPGIMEKLKEYGKWGAKEGWDIGKAVIPAILAEYAKGRI
ncbi:MAG: pentapeptide repeat-containing protein [Candidatus Brocadiales bacterium]